MRLRHQYSVTELGHSSSEIWTQGSWPLQSAPFDSKLGVHRFRNRSRNSGVDIAGRRPSTACQVPSNSAGTLHFQGNFTFPSLSLLVAVKPPLPPALRWCLGAGCPVPAPRTLLLYSTGTKHYPEAPPRRCGPCSPEIHPSRSVHGQEIKPEATRIIIIAFGQVCAVICKICDSLDTLAEHGPRTRILLHLQPEKRADWVRVPGGPHSC